ncbi:MAG: response regulator [Burkholderiales bacterium]|jgi:two-component system OmpR family response regulator
MRILIAEDDQLLADGLTRALRAAGYATDCVNTGGAADTAVSTQAFDLIILDIGLPGMDGLEVLQRLRARKVRTPVMILTALDGVSHRVKGLDLGADDYLVKPFSLEELEARVRALTRRAGGQVTGLVEVGRLSFDPVNRAAMIDGSPLELSARETALLEILLSRAGRVVSKDNLIDLLCQWGEEVSANAVEVYVHRLRKKIEAADVALRTIRGLGYTIDKPSSASNSAHNGAADRAPDGAMSSSRGGSQDLG